MQKKAGGVSLNEYVTKHGASKDVFLVIQYFVNGWAEGLTNDMAVSIRDGKVSWEIKNKMLVVNGEDICKAPNNWEDREKNYNEAVKYFK